MAQKSPDEFLKAFPPATVYYEIGIGGLEDIYEWLVRNDKYDIAKAFWEEAEEFIEFIRKDVP